jgi:hypothetical protein
LADGLFGGVAVQAFRAGIPDGDDAVQGARHDGIPRRIHDGPEDGQRFRGLF